MISGIRHVGLVVGDLEAAMNFWCGLLGFHVHRRLEESGPYIDAILGLRDVRVTTVKLAAADGTLIELLRFQSHPDQPQWTGTAVSTGLTHVALTVTDLDSVYRTLTDAGVEFHSPPQATPDGYAKVTYCVGPERVLLELVEVVAL